MSATPRQAIELAIEALVVLLDAFEPDPDLEPDLDNEPGTWTEAHNNRGHCAFELDDLEGDERELDPAELGEPEDRI